MSILGLRFSFIISVFLLPSFLLAQGDDDRIIALNNYVNFTNESIHGLLIAHRLLENFNQDINKYADLEGQQINFYSNKDLPKDLFEDPEQWFYDVSPQKLHKQLIEESALIKDATRRERMNALSSRMKNICGAVNKLRFDLERYIDANDLTQRNKLQGVYDLLEKGVKMYDNFFESQAELEEMVAAETAQLKEQSKKSQLYVSMVNSSVAVKQLLRTLRSKEESSYKGEVVAAEKAFEVLNQNMNTVSPTGRYGMLRERVRSKCKDAIASAKDFYLTAEVSDEYKQYGKFYYYHNSNIINKFNRYGNGMVFEMNRIIDDLKMNRVKMFEEPHYFKVIYPKVIAKDDHLASSDDKIEVIPTELKEREIVSSKHVLIVDSLKVELELFDHMIKDGDRVSINFNGDWVLNDVSLEAEPIKLKVKLNEEGENYLLIHAENIGRRPPNTCTVAYRSKGKREKVAMRSDLNTSQLIELRMGEVQQVKE